MREYGLQSLSRSIIQSTYKKKNFFGDSDEKAYLIGFRLGDLNVYQTVNSSEVIIVRCHTTRQDQINLMRQLFEPYGQVTISMNKRTKSYHVNCYMNKTFAFLLPKNTYRVARWITSDPNCSAAFAAGYIDAEANIGIYDGRARLKIDTYDKHVIFWFYRWFIINGISCPPPQQIGLKNQIYNTKTGWKYHNDLWRIRVSKVRSLIVLFTLLKPHLKHKKRVEDMSRCIQNIYDRVQKK
ncbi:MAG: hypothetical protein HYV32_05370 [Candidatus Kerfeldbacteria bacterium]|nr:hypothetical protein [Candidatus Kerfeldbacteria bacterium]